MSESNSIFWPHRGCLVKTSEGPLAHRVFFASRGYRHWITDPSWIIKSGFIPEHVQEVGAPVVEALAPGQQIPMGTWTAKDRKDPPRDSSLKMREVAASHLTGVGIEFGAGSSPFPIPLRCRVHYADVRDFEGLVEEAYRGQDISMMAVPHYVMDFQEMELLKDESQDFIVGCHVIEHVRSPLTVLKRAYEVLKPGGSLVLIIPDKERTFDHDRGLTPLDHLITDFNDPSRERDKEHFKEFYEKAFVTTKEDFEDTWTRHWEEEYPIHYHTWTYESFMEMIQWATSNIAPFTKVWSQPTLDHKTHDIEFYVTLTK